MGISHLCLNIDPTGSELFLVLMCDKEVVKDGKLPHNRFHKKKSCQRSYQMNIRVCNPRVKPAVNAHTLKSEFQAVP